MMAQKRVFIYKDGVRDGYFEMMSLRDGDGEYYGHFDTAHSRTQRLSHLASSADD